MFDIPIVTSENNPPMCLTVAPLWRRQCVSLGGPNERPLHSGGVMLRHTQTNPIVQATVAGTGQIAKWQLMKYMYYLVISTMNFLVQ